MELDLLRNAIESNWVAPLGPHVDAFEQELAELVAGRAGVPHALALSSGTAALHLALVVLGIGPGDAVVCSSLTFSASANAIHYTGATPVFVDADPATWTIDSDPPRAGTRRAPEHPRRRRRRPLRAVLRLRRPERGLPAQERDPRPGRRRVTRRLVPRRAVGRAGRPRRVLVQRQQGDHDERRRHARLSKRRLDRARAEALDTGARPGTPLRAHRDRLQLPPQQPAGGGRPGAARGAPRACRGKAPDQRGATGSCSRTRRGSASCPRRATGRATAG